jgi:hypothetical protein
MEGHDPHEEISKLDKRISALEVIIAELARSNERLAVIVKRQGELIQKMEGAVTWSR